MEEQKHMEQECRHHCSVELKEIIRKIEDGYFDWQPAE